jgi:hypothetical protein
LVGKDQGEVSENIEVDTNALLGIVEEEVVVAPVVWSSKKEVLRQAAQSRRSW